jgi:hypothetical protein
MVFVIREGQLLLLIVTVGVLLGSVAGALPLGRSVKAALFIVAPIAAVGAYHIINPDPGCTYDCPGKLGWSLLFVFGVGAWWLGLVVGAFSRWLINNRTGHSN